MVETTDQAAAEGDHGQRTAAEAKPIRVGRNPFGFWFWLPVVWLGFVVLCALTADMLPLPESDAMDFGNEAAPPGIAGEATFVDANGEEFYAPYTYWLGTDGRGRDIVTRLIYGARVSLTIGLLAPLVGLVLGGATGILAGYYRGRLEATITAMLDAILAFPALVLLLAITFYIGSSLLNLTIALGLLSIPFYARVARANTLTFAEREFVLAARAMGASDFYIIVREILPNVVLPLLVYGLLVVAALIVVEGTLSFLGVGLPAPTPSWGGMIAEGREMLDEAPHVSLLPVSVMFLTVLSFNLLGDTLRGFSDPRESRL